MVILSMKEQLFNSTIRIFTTQVYMMKAKYTTSSGYSCKMMFLTGARFDSATSLKMHWLHSERNLFDDRASSYSMRNIGLNLALPHQRIEFIFIQARCQVAECGARTDAPPSCGKSVIHRNSLITT